MKPLFFNAVKGLAIFALCSVSLIFILCFIAIQFDDPEQLVLIFSNIALFLSAFLGGRFSVGKNGKKFISGLIVGIFGALIILLLSLILSSFDAVSFLRMALTVLVSVLGALSKKSVEKQPSSAKKRKNIAKRYGAYR